MDLAKNMADVKRRVAAACARANRSIDEVKIVAVTKYVDAQVVRQLIGLGASHIGENRVQDAEKKFREAELNQTQVKTHMIGHLQRNKVAACIRLFHLIHSVDSVRLAEEIDKQSRKLNRVTPCLLQVNVSGEETKHGFAPSEVKEAIGQIAGMTNIQVVGLMTMAPFVEPEETRSVFRSLRILRDEINGLEIPNVRLTELSIGMSNDFEVAIEEGATLVRIGSAFFRE